MCATVISTLCGSAALHARARKLAVSQSITEKSKNVGGNCLAAGVWTMREWPEWPLLDDRRFWADYMLRVRCAYYGGEYETTSSGDGMDPLRSVNHRVSCRKQVGAPVGGIGSARLTENATCVSHIQRPATSFFPQRASSLPRTPVTVAEGLGRTGLCRPEHGPDWISDRRNHNKQVGDEFPPSGFSDGHAQIARPTCKHYRPVGPTTQVGRWRNEHAGQDQELAQRGIWAATRFFALVRDCS